MVHFLMHSSFGGMHYSLDEPRIVKCVLKSRSFVGPFKQITDEKGVDLSHIDRRLHDVVGDSWRVGPCEYSA